MNTAAQEWEAYVAHERAALAPLLAEWGLVLDSEQPHISGERYLLQTMHDVGDSGKKLILTGTLKGQQVLVKATSDPAGKREIAAERNARNTIQNLPFSYHLFTAPQEIRFVEGDLTVSVTEFIEQESTFLERPLTEQFALALRALKIQEGAHATTYSHIKAIKRAFGSITADEYLTRARAFAGPNNNADLRLLEVSRKSIEQYCGFLTHADFVPHNLRIRKGEIYLLDYASIHFGNKHESWARFMNFMMLYNPALERALDQYIRDNRAPEEYESLRAMRVYKLLFLLHFYRTNLPLTADSMRTLTEARITFWTEALDAVREGRVLPQSSIERYEQLRDSMRSEDEKKRQQGLH